MKAGETQPLRTLHRSSMPPLTQLRCLDARHVPLRCHVLQHLPGQAHRVMPSASAMLEHIFGMM